MAPHKEIRSLSRQYEVVMESTVDKSDIDIVTLVDLPVTLINNVDTVRVYYAKYVPKDYAIASVTPFEQGEGAEVAEAEEQNPDYVGIGDDLDYVGPIEEDKDGFSIVDTETEKDPED